VAVHSGTPGVVLRAAVDTFVSFFRRPYIGRVLAFLLLYRFAEAQLVKMSGPFMLDEKSLGGLELSTFDVGFVYGTVGVVLLTFGGILGGILAARHGLRRWFGWMVVAINLPNVAYVILAYQQVENLLLINLAVGIEQFGYGFGFTAYLLYMIYIARGPHSTAHYAICTGFMSLGMMLPGMVSGWLQELLGYQNFFIWILVATIPSFLVVWAVPLDRDFGKSSAP
jgi:PAT family beta-lactamase induction signal transducer AmpG